MKTKSSVVETDDLVIRHLGGSPDLLSLHRLSPERYPYLLESTSENSKLARYDILFAFPQSIVSVPADPPATHSSDFLAQLDWVWREERTDTIDSGNLKLPFTGGWFLFLSYELVREFETVHAEYFLDKRVPLALAARIPAAIIRDRQDNNCWLVAERGAEQRDGLLQAMTEDIGTAVTEAISAFELTAINEQPAARYLEAVKKVKHYIREGDIFQANLSRSWTTQLPAQIRPDQIYSRLRKSNPSPFSGLARLSPQTTVISSSPERLVEVRGNNIRTRPIAGTYPRSTDHDTDRKQSTDLLAHPKERAEHIMLIDLERNDLGRVCIPGSVKVPEFMVLESYQHVHHIVSEVCGTLRDEVTPGEVIAATFPGGTITGCPKIRCIEIIAELEQAPRGAYTGSMGYLNRDGSMDLNILIRTMVQHGNELSFRAGAGIVADSEPERELAETRAKAEGLLRALTR